MITFRIRQNYVQSSGRLSDLKKLRKYLALPAANAYWRNHHVTNLMFFGWRSKRFAYGLWPQVKMFCKIKHIKFKAYTKRKTLLPIFYPHKIGSVSLYKHQVRSCNAWLAAGGSGIVWAGAGAGKTEIAAALIKVMLKRKLVTKVLFIVNTLDLLDQGTERLQARLGIKIGSLAEPRMITVSLIQGIDVLIKNKDPKLLKYLSSIDMLVYDEVHHGKSDQSARLSKACPAFYRLGLSARPLLVDYKTYSQKLLKEEYENRNGDIKERIIVKAGDARTLSFLGPIVKRVPPSVLIKAGLLARPTIYLYPLSYKDDSAEDLSWPSAKRDLIIRNRVIHNVTRKCALAAARAGETTLVVSGGSKELGLHVYQELRDANLNVAYLHGGIKKDVRTKSRHKLSTKKLEVIVATTIYDEGVDVSNLRLLVLPYGGLSPFKTEQRLGRGLRQKMGANEAVVIAFMHYGNKHLRKHSYANLKQWLEEEAYRIKLVTNRHSSYVKKLVGVDNIVDNLPDKKLFMELKHNDNGKHKDRIEATKESIEQ